MGSSIRVLQEVLHGQFSKIGSLFLAETGPQFGELPRCRHVPSCGSVHAKAFNPEFEFPDPEL